MLVNRFLRNKYAILFSIYIVVLIFFAAFSYKISFHDTFEYIFMAKQFAGYANSNTFSVHSLLYPFFLSFFVKYLPSILTLKLVNLIWIVSIGLLLYKSELKKKSFLIWVFSPIAWIMSVAIAPILPATFFLLIAYLSIIKWQENKRSLYFIISALALGLSAAFYDLALIFALFFILAFFYNKKFKDVIFYTLFVFLSFSTRLLLDASFFILTIKDTLIPFPFYSLIRFWGAMLIIKLGLHPVFPVSKLSFFSFHYLHFLFIISPLLLYLLKINYKKYKHSIIFLALSTSLLLIQGSYYHYYLPLAPIMIILLSKTFKRKEILCHILVSCFIIFIIVNPYFIPDKQEIKNRNLVINDLKTINQDFSFDVIVFDTDTFAMIHLWDKNLPFIMSPYEYNYVSQNDKYYTYYVFEVKPKIDTQKILEIQLGLKPNIKDNIDYETLPWLLEKGKAAPEGYDLVKCYELLCVYQKILVSA